METLLYRLVQERNARETFPFVGIHDSNNILLKEADAWQQKCEQLENKVVAQQESLERVAVSNQTGDDESDTNTEKRDDNKIVELHYAESAALKNERKMREELERLRGQVKTQDERHRKHMEELRDSNKSLLEFQELCKTYEKDISNLKDQNEKQERSLGHLSTQVSDGEQRASLAEQQCVGLKDTIRILQEENDQLKNENQQFATRLIEEKNRLSSEVNSLNEMLEQLRKESKMLQSVKKQEEKRKSWFGFSSSEDTTAKTTPTKTAVAMASPEASRRQYIPNSFEEDSRTSVTKDVKKGPPVSVVPSEPKQIIQAHRQEAACVR